MISAPTLFSLRGAEKLYGPATTLKTDKNYKKRIYHI